MVLSFLFEGSSLLAPLLILLASAAASWLLGIAVNRFLLRCQIMDLPNQRSSHTRPTVRGGGIAIIATVLAVGLWLLWRSERQPLLAVGLCMLGVAVVSFRDDMKPVGVTIRLGCHFVAAVVGLIALGTSRTPAWAFPGVGLLPVAVCGVLACIWIVGYTNAFNFMDGINGLAGGQAVLTGLGMALLTGLSAGNFSLAPVVLGLVVAGAALGFLPHNFPSARMFMGDVGSAPVGFLLGILVLWLATSASAWLLIPLGLLHANFALDATITLVRRVGHGDHWSEPHREHFYQRLVRSGKSHAFVTSWELGLQGVVLGLLLLYLQASVLARVGLGLVVILMWLTFFAFCEISFHRQNSRPPAQAQNHACIQAGNQ